MSMGGQTILHVEDDQAIANTVSLIFKSFGFQGEMLAAATVSAAKELLDRRGKSGESLSLIISDMNLPDGTGLDVIREVRKSFNWKLTPIIILSSETDERVVDSAYALGANCYIPKMTSKKSPVDSLRDLYQCWLETAHLPRVVNYDRVRRLIERSIENKARFSELYTRLAESSHGDPGEMEFWLNLALSEGNLSNLLTFLGSGLSHCAMPQATISKVEDLQDRIKIALQSAMEALQNRWSPEADFNYRIVLDVLDPSGEETVAEAFGYLFPVNPVATKALRNRAACQFELLSNHVLTKSQDSDLVHRAESLLGWSKRLKEE